MRREYDVAKINTIPPIDGYTCWFDAIDNENTGIHNNYATTFYDRTGNFYLSVKNGSFVWDKNNVKLSLPNGSEATANPDTTFGLGSNNFTVMFVASFNDLFDAGDAHYVLGETFMYNPGTNRWTLTVAGRNFVFMQHNGSSWNTLMRSSISLEKNKEYFVVLRRNNNNFSMLVNGVVVATYYGNLSFNVQGSPKIAIIGASSKYYTGIVYKKYLSDSDINDMRVWLQSYYGVQLQPYIPKVGSYVVDLNGEWQNGAKNPDSTNYVQYQSFAHIGIDSSYDSMKITFSGYDNFTVYINSYAESNYDYTIAFNMDTAKPTSLPAYNSSNVKAHTRGKQYSPSGSVNSNYTRVDYPNDGGQHFIWIVYRKDGSSASYDDRGYVLIPKIN